MTGFHDLPRELRHMILQYTFENDIIKDVRLNHHLYSRWLSFHRGHDGRYSDGYWGILVYIKREICSEVGYAQSCAPDNYPAPSLHQTIIKMIKAAPDLSDDTIFVGSLALSALEKAVNGLASEPRESYFEDWEKLGGGHAEFPGLLRELRLQIPQLAFDDAAEDDCTLNGMFKNKFLYFGPSNEVSRTSRGWIKDEEINIKCYIAILNERKEFTPLDFGIYAPRIHGLATEITSACPEVEDDGSYVLDKALGYLEVIHAEKKKAIRA